MKAMGPWSDGSQKICRSQKEQSPTYLNPGSEEINDQLKLGMMQGKIKNTPTFLEVLLQHFV